MVTNDDKVYAFGNNSNGVLGFGNYKFRFFGFLNNLNYVNQLTHNEELSHKQIIDFKNGDCYVITLTIPLFFFLGTGFLVSSGALILSSTVRIAFLAPVHENS
jgi:hypothetical protein